MSDFILQKCKLMNSNGQIDKLDKRAHFALKSAENRMKEKG